MSKASKWAKALTLAREALLDEKTRRPKGPPDVYIVGRAQRLRFYITESGDPSVIYLNTKDEVLAGGDITWAEDRQKLLEAARWILDTFSEP